MSGKKPAHGLLAVWLLALAGMVFYVGRRHAPPPTHERLWPVPPFEMIGVTPQGITALRREDLLGHPWVANFIFTRCGGPCPLMSQKIAALQRILPSHVRLVSFTVDPEHDTPAVLQAYAERYRADPRRWVFVRGTKEALHALVQKGFRLPMAETGDARPGFQLAHSTKFVFVDAQGYVRKVYDSEQAAFFETMKKEAEE